MSTTKYVDEDIVKAIEDAMPPYTAGVWRLCCETGVRVSDAIGARVKDFDSENRYHFEAHKTGKKGSAIVSSEFVSRYIGKKKYRQHLFPSPKKANTHVTRQTVYNHVKMACDKLGIESDGIAPHSGRKHFAVETYHKFGLGATMKALQHKDVGTTMIYALSDDALHKLIIRVKRLEKLVEQLVDEVFGDDLIAITPKGKKALAMAKAVTSESD